MGPGRVAPSRGTARKLAVKRPGRPRRAPARSRPTAQRAFLHGLGRGGRASAWAICTLKGRDPNPIPPEDRFTVSAGRPDAGREPAFDDRCAFGARGSGGAAAPTGLLGSPRFRAGAPAENGSAGTFARASFRQRRCSSSLRSGARTRRRRACAPDATGPAKWRFRWSSGGSLALRRETLALVLAHNILTTVG
jgi:hypothetical protein